jgi:hypothetical protein
MADVKISALPAATTPVAGTEVLPIVQSGTTKKLTIADVTAGRAMSASSLTLTSPLGVASGGTGISSFGAGIATFLGTPSSANLAAAVTDETGTGALVFGTSPTFTTSAIFPAGTVGAPSITTTGDTNTGIYFPAADTIGFVEGGVEAMRLDASGNLGLGVTPSAWDGVYRVFQIGGNPAIASQESGQWIANAYYNGDWKYIASGRHAARYELNRANAGVHAWFTAPSGTAGNAISFTQAMTLSSAGDLLINTTAEVGSGANSRLNILHNGLSEYGLSVKTSYNGLSYFVTFVNSSGTQIGRIENDTSTSTAYVTSSDISLKTNVAPSDSALASMLAFPVDQYDWKEGGHVEYGCIAQKAVSYAPEIVSKGDVWGVDYGRITPRLIKAFQELAAKVTALEAANG